jgi:hypothetical protein
MTARKLLLVTGAARSGTLYTATALQAIGVRVGHEYTDVDGTVSHFFAADLEKHPNAPSKAPKGRCIHVGERRRDFAFDHIWHQTRHPLRVISSLRFTGVRRRDLLEACGVDVRSSGPTYRALRYWIEWTALADEQAEWRYRIEDIEAVWPEMLDRLGRWPVPLPPVPRDTHTERRWEQPFTMFAEDESGKKEQIPVKVKRQLVTSTPDLTWAALEKAFPEETLQARRLAAVYGYE